MALFKKKQRADPEAEKLKSFLDMIAPSLVKFEFDRYFCGNSIRCVWALREYPTATDDQAILRHLGEMHGVTLHVYTRIVTPLEESRIVHNAEIRNRMKRNSTQNIQQAVEAESNLQDVKTLVGSMHRNKESLMHCAVYTLTGVIFVYASLGIAVTFFILRSYFLSIPKEMEEAAMMDGCGYISTYFRIIVPIAKPGLATAAIMAFLNNWNEYYFASILLKSKEHMTLPALLGQFTTAYSKNLNGMFSAIILIVLPTIIIFCLLSETFVKSLTAGAVKG